MKYTLIILLLLMQSGCGSSTGDGVNILVGSWVSNCHERTDASGSFIAYTIKKLEITDDTYETITLDQADVSCTVNSGVAFVIDQTYTLGEQVITTDGVEAQRITFNSDFDFFGQPVKTTTENIYRVTGVELNFGAYISSVTPSLDYAVTYIKQ